MSAAPHHVYVSNGDVIVQWEAKGPLVRFGSDGTADEVWQVPPADERVFSTEREIEREELLFEFNEALEELHRIKRGLEGS